MSFWLAWPASPSSLGPLIRLGPDGGLAAGASPRRARVALEHAPRPGPRSCSRSRSRCRCAGRRGPGNCRPRRSHHLLLDVLGEAALVVGLQRGGERAGALVDDLGAFEDFLVAFSMPSMAAPSSPAARVMRRSRPSPMSAASSRLLRAMVSCRRASSRLSVCTFGVGQVGLRRSCRLLCVRRGVPRRATAAEHLLDAKNITLHATPPRIPGARFLAGRRLTQRCR